MFKSLRVREEGGREQLVRLAHHSMSYQYWQQRPSTDSDRPENQGTTSKEVDFGVPKTVGRSWEQSERCQTHQSDGVQQWSTEMTECCWGAARELPGCGG